ncbi:hypothetical protein HG531_002339 [Fusarium graminearum]|nr:hypothetical protein HG531_002339 [Fusarium graminearum]
MPEKFTSGHVVGDQNVSLAYGVGDLLLLYDNLLLQNLHGIDALSILLSHLVHLTKSTLANKLENIEILWTELFLLGPVVNGFEEDFAGRRLLSHSVCMTLKLEPTLNRSARILAGLEVDMTEKLISRCPMIIY